MNILIVDDKEEGRYLLEVLLKGNGHDVTAVANGAEAIERLKSGGFELIISDILMPVMDGFELCRKVKTDKTLRRIPFIIYTATYTDPQDEAYALKIGADRFILKPCEPEVFLTAIEEVMAAAGRRDIASLQPLKEEKETFRLYSERLVKKLEDKMMQLEREVQTRRESEEKYRILAENSLQGLLIVQDFRIVFANKTFAEITGYTVEALLSLLPEKVMAMIHPEDQPLVWGRFRDRLVGKTVPSRYEYRGIRNNGSVIWLEMFASFIEYRGKPAIQGAVVDITERKRAQEALRESEESFKTIAENAYDGIIITGSDGMHVYANQRASEITGYSVEELLRIGMKGLAHPDEISKLSERLKKRITGEKFLRQYETAILNKEGKGLPIEITASRISWHSQFADLVILRDITERKRAEEELLKEKTFSDTAINSLPGIFYLFDEQGRLLRWNTNFGVVTGYSDEEISTMHPLDFFTDEGKEKIKATIQEVFSKGSSFVESHLLSKDGSRNPYFFTGRRFVSDNQKYLAGMGIDITERKRAEETLKKSEEAYRNLVETARDVIFIIYPDGTLASLNPAFHTITGWSVADWVGKPFGPLLHPDDLPLAIEKFSRALQGELNEVFELRISTRSGGYEVGEFIIAPQIQNEKVVNILGIARDITERKRAEEALHASEAQLSNALKIAHLGHWEYDVASDLFTFNDHFYAIFRTTAKREAGYTMSSAQYAQRFVHPDDHSVVSAEIQKALETTNPHYSRQLEHRMLYADGEVGHIAVRFFVIKDDKGRTVKTYGVNQDITDPKRAEAELVTLQEQLRQSQKMEAIGRLAGGIAHDFNNLLTVIKGNSQLSLLDLREGDPLKTNIEEIRKASERASDLISQLLAFSRKQIMEMQVLNVNIILKRLDNMLHRVLGEDIEMVTILTEGIGKIKADPGQIEQVIVNLAVNSRDAMPDGGKLTIETANVELDEEYARKHIAVKPGQYVMLSVSDTGMGMTPEVQERVFEPFFTTKEIGKGTGLGLSTVYGIVKQSGGNIWVYSEAGKGTAFKIYLPQVDEPLTELKEVASKGIPRGDETILIVEDEETVRKLAVRILKSLGYRTFEAPEGGRALIFCEEFKEPIHLILTDVVMPRMSGLKLVECLKEIHPEIKVLYMSGYTDNAILHHGVLEKGTNFIQKPFTLENLARKVREVLDKV